MSRPYCALDGCDWPCGDPFHEAEMTVVDISTEDDADYYDYGDML